MRSTNTRLWAFAIAASAAFGCFQAREVPPPEGGESHFLASCIDGECGGGLSCLCGVCTRACDGKSECATLAKDAICMPWDARTQTCDEAMHLNTCDERCTKNDDCRDGFECAEHVCREASSEDAGAKGDGGIAVDEGPVQPLVMLLIDTSGSMERTPDCDCMTSGCDECFPDCDTDVGPRSRWALLLSALTGSFESFGCERDMRYTENGATYDEGYSMPYHRVLESAVQRSDGPLEAYATRVRFGLATFDAIPTWKGSKSGDLVTPAAFDSQLSSGVDGLFSYPPREGIWVRQDGTATGVYRYPNCPEPYEMNTGIRSAAAADGALSFARTAAEGPAQAAAIRSALRETRTFGGTPIAAALDDLYYFFNRDPQGPGPRREGEKHYVVLLTDGEPDPDFRDFGCDCALKNDCPADEDPAQMKCPYPTAEDAVRNLRCRGTTCTGGVDRVYVIGIGASFPKFEEKLHPLAIAGGTEHAYMANDDADIRFALQLVMGEIAIDANLPE